MTTIATDLCIPQTLKEGADVCGELSSSWVPSSGRVPSGYETNSRPRHRQQDRRAPMEVGRSFASWTRLSKLSPRRGCHSSTPNFVS